MALGARYRIGLILPSANITMEPQFYEIGLRDISFHASRVPLGLTTPEALLKMTEGLDDACRLIADVNPDVVAYACTSGTFIKGLDWERSLVKRIEKIVGCPAITTSSAMVGALTTLGVTSVAVATPYIDSVNREEKKFLEENGLRVPVIKGLQIIEAEPLRTTTSETIYELTAGLNSTEVDGFFISCTNLRSMEVIERLEEDLGKPVTSSTQATLWAVLRKIHYPDKISGYGRLLRFIS